MTSELIIREIENLSEEKQKEVFDFVLFLNSRLPSAQSEKNGKSILGRAKGEVWIADDFNDTPDCMMEYV